MENDKKNILEKIDVNQESFTPIYYQLKEQLLKLIKTNEIKDGDKLPSENELSNYLNISRSTVRRSLEEITHLGLAKRERGKGTIVTNAKITQPLVQVKSFTKCMTEAGLNPESKIIQFNIINPEDEISEKLNIRKNQKVRKISRIRLIEEKPVAYQTSYIALSKTKNFEKYKDDLKSQSLYKILEKQYNLKPNKITETIEVRRAKENIAKILEIAINDPLFYVEANINSKKMPIEYLIAYYKVDRFKFYVENEID